MRRPVPKSRFRKGSLRMKLCNLAFFDEIAAHLLGARMTELEKGFILQIRIWVTRSRLIIEFTFLIC